MIQQNNVVPAPKATAVSTTPKTKRYVAPTSTLPGRKIPIASSKTNSNANTKPVQDSGGSYEAKLVEMINTSIVDASPSVKWEDVGKTFQYLGLYKLFKFSLSMPLC